MHSKRGGFEGPRRTVGGFSPPGGGEGGKRPRNLNALPREGAGAPLEGGEGGRGARPPGNDLSAPKTPVGMGKKGPLNGGPQVLLGGDFPMRGFDKPRVGGFGGGRRGPPQGKGPPPQDGLFQKQPKLEKPPWGPPNPLSQLVCKGSPRPQLSPRAPGGFPWG